MAKSRLISSIVPLRVPRLVSKCWPRATQIDCYTGEVSLVSDPVENLLKLSTGLREISQCLVKDVKDVTKTFILLKAPTSAFTESIKTLC